jgi:hypothetical protein
MVHTMVREAIVPLPPCSLEILAVHGKVPGPNPYFVVCVTNYSYNKTFFLVFYYTHNYLLAHVTTYMCLVEEDDVTSTSIAQGLTICMHNSLIPTKN